MSALRQAAKQALKEYDRHSPLAVVMEELRAALAEEALQRLTNVQQEIEAALEQQAEPVAWWHKKSDTFTSGSLISHFTEWLPLYTTPPQRKPCMTCEALARAVMMDQTGRDA